MAHTRKLIRDNIVSALTGLSTVGNKVYVSHVYQLNSSNLPGIVIYTGSEESQYATISLPRTINRSLQVNVEIYVKGVANYDDDIDQITLEVENALYGDLTRGGYAQDTKVVSVDVQYRGEGDQPVAVAVMSVVVMYTTLEGSLL